MNSIKLFFQTRLIAGRIKPDWNCTLGKQKVRYLTVVKNNLLLTSLLVEKERNWKEINSNKTNCLKTLFDF